MNRSVLRLGLVVLLAVAMCAAPSSLFAQGSTTQTLSGTVIDTTGAVIPGADVSAKHNGTGVVNTAVSNGEGLFSIPSLPIGAYTVSVTLQGFKTVIINNVVLTSGAPANVKATMEIGGVSEQVTVASSSEIVQTQSSDGLADDQHDPDQQLPISSRSAMDFVNFLPGVTTRTATARRSSTGCRAARSTSRSTASTSRTTRCARATASSPSSARVSTRSKRSRSRRPSQGAGDAGQGAVQVKFVTRSGTNSFTGSGYYFQRRDKLNANTWFNNRNGVAKTKLKQDQAGFRVGGPIVIPGLFDGHNKAFFFANYEELRQPSQVTRNNRNVLNPAAQAGNYSYITGGQTVTVNVLQLAAANGQLASVDPTVGELLSDIRGAVAGGSLANIDPNLQRFSFNVPVDTMRRYPTFRLDYNLNTANRASFAYNYQKFTDFPDTLNNREVSFPGFAVGAGQSSVRLGWAGSVRSTLEPQPGQRSAPRLQRRARHVLRRIEHGDVHEPVRVPAQFPDSGIRADQPGRRRLAAVA